MGLYRFRSRETADIIMMQPQARKVLELLGKDPSRSGVLLHQDLQTAGEILRAAVLNEEAQRRAAEEAAAGDGEPMPEFEGISLRQRTRPLLEMFERCDRAGVDVVWEL